MGNFNDKIFIQIKIYKRFLNLHKKVDLIVGCSMHKTGAFQGPDFGEILSLYGYLMILRK